MPFRPEHSLLRVEVPALHTIDTSSVENLFGMWSLFSKASHAMENGRRLENMSWRLWNRETFCCAQESTTTAADTTLSQSCPPPRKSKFSISSGDIPMPTLSSSFESVSSADDSDLDDEAPPHATVEIPQARPELRRQRSHGREKHITSVALEKMVIAIEETPKVAPIELPSKPAIVLSKPATVLPRITKTAPVRQTTPLDSSDSIMLDSPQTEQPSGMSTVHPSASQVNALESSSSTVQTNATKSTDTSQTVGSHDSSSTEMSSTHSIIRGFIPGGAPSSYRSQTNLAAAQPTPILKTSPKYHQTLPKKKGAMFTIGTSSGEDESSLDSHMYRSSLSESLRRSIGSSKKQTSFKDEVAVAAKPSMESAVFESDDEDEEVSESAIEEDDDSSDWEDSDEHSGPSSVNENQLFQRVDSRPNLTSRRSLLTTLMHEPDRAKALANAASKSTPALRRARVSSANGPSNLTSPEPEAQEPINGLQRSKPQPIIPTTSNMYSSQQLALSPRTTRRNMLSTELTESLRKNLLWERQHKSTGNLAALKRRHTSQDMKNLKQHPEPAPILSHTDNDRKRYTNDYFHAGLGEYHTKGW